MSLIERLRNWCSSAAAPVQEVGRAEEQEARERRAADLRDSYRKDAEEMRAKLSRIGELRIVQRDPTPYSCEFHVEVWSAYKYVTGWTPAKTRDDDGNRVDCVYASRREAEEYVGSLMAEVAADAATRQVWSNAT